MKERAKQLFELYKSFDIKGANKLQVTLIAIGSAVVAIVKFILGFVIHSFVWSYSGLYALGMAVGKEIFLKCSGDPVPSKKKALYSLIIAAIVFVAGFFFDMCIMVKQFSNDLSAHYPIPVVIAASIYFVFSYCLSIHGIWQTRKNKDIEFYAYKIICISGSLMNMVLLQRMILSCIEVSDEMTTMINSRFGYFIGSMLIVSSVILLVRCILALKKEKAG
ncbi:MAG: hypothetical protein NC299_17965 [Lachnospiraceae bacterium]|nr:hypothetical protein [Ruminococcus sp.]MCM1277215.1 hypothetical protein [Lachnospiraceae bacterium]